MRLTLWLILVSLSACVPREASAAEVMLAVASNFTATAEFLKTDFAKQSPHHVTIIGGASGKLAAQVIQGAPYDIFLAADTQLTTKLAQQGLSLGTSEFTYALGRLAVWSADNRILQRNGEAVLKEGNFHKLAYANPKLAPYGVAAEETLKSIGVFDELKKKAVIGENVGQAFSMIASGAAELGFVALSQVIGSEAGKRGSYWEVPRELYAPIRQNAVVLARAAANTGAAEFMNYLRSDRARNIIREAGYDIPAD